MYAQQREAGWDFVVYLLQDTIELNVSAILQKSWDIAWPQFFCRISLSRVNGSTASTATHKQHVLAPQYDLPQIGHVFSLASNAASPAA